MEIRLQHNSMQFSDSHAHHEHDVRAVFRYAKSTGSWFVTGTESGVGNDLHEDLIKLAPRYNFRIYAQRWGEWVAINRQFLTHVEHGFMGPYIPGTHGLLASEGGHGPRGISWMSAKPKDYAKEYPLITVGVAHYLTRRSMLATHHTNDPLIAGIQEFGSRMGRKNNIVFFAADANLNDRIRDVFNGGPFTTIWDELNLHPSTHIGSNTTMDIIASYDRDGRVVGKTARALQDNEIKLFTDHRPIVATYEARGKNA